MFSPTDLTSSQPNMRSVLASGLRRLRKARCSPFREPKIRIRLLHRAPDRRDRSGWLRILVGLGHQFGSGRLAGWFPAAARGPSLVPLSPTNRPFLAAAGATFLA